MIPNFFGFGTCLQRITGEHPEITKNFLQLVTLNCSSWGCHVLSYQSQFPEETDLVEEKQHFWNVNQPCQHLLQPLHLPSWIMSWMENKVINEKSELPYQNYHISLLDITEAWVWDFKWRPSKKIAECAVNNFNHFWPSPDGEYIQIE